MNIVEVKEALKQKKIRLSFYERMDLNKGHGPQYDSMRLYKNSGAIDAIKLEIEGLENELLRLQGKAAKIAKLGVKESDRN